MDYKNIVDGYHALIAAHRPLHECEAQQLRDYYRVGLTCTSNALEGNSLTLSETAVVLQDGLTVGGRPLRDFYETVGHGKAYDYMCSLAGNTLIQEEDACELHRLFYEDLDKKNAGQYREVEVVVTGSAYELCNPVDISDAMKALFDWYAQNSQALHPVEAAAELHRRFVYIHPFVDGNGRTARLLMNLSLIQNGYQIVCIPPIRRLDYISALERAHKVPSVFVDFIMEMEMEAQRDYMRLLHIDYRSRELPIEP